MNDPLLTSDLAVVNQELGRRGFTADIYFDPGEDVLSDDTRDKLARNAELLKSQPQFLITIEGHTDSRGTNEETLRLASDGRLRRGITCILAACRPIE